MNPHKSLRICFVALYAESLFFPQQASKFGGSEVQLYVLGKNLAEQSLAMVSFITGGTSQQSVQKIDHITVYPYINTTMQRLRWLYKIIGLRKLWLALRQAKADIYIQRSMGIETFFIALFCKLFRRKFVYMVAHDWDVNTDFEKHNGIIGKLANWGMKQAQVITVQHAQQQQLLQKNYGRSANIFPTIYPLVKNILPLEQRNSIVWVGRAETWKQPEIFIQLVQELPDQQFIMIMPESNYPELYQRIHQFAKILPNLKLINYVPFQEISKYFAQAKLLVNTSSIEGFPNTFIQAAQYGTPIISLAVDPDQIVTRYLGKVAAGDTKQLKQLCLKLSTNEVMWQDIHHSSLHYMQEHHESSRFSQEFMRLIC